MIFNQTEKQEKEYLQQVITTIHDTINTTSTSVKEHIDTLAGVQGLSMVEQRYRSPRNPFHARKHIKSFCIR